MKEKPHIQKHLEMKNNFGIFKIWPIFIEKWPFFRWKVKKKRPPHVIWTHDLRFVDFFSRDRFFLS